MLLELKSDPTWYNVFQPSPAKYAQLIIDFLNKNPFYGRLIIQSLDPLLLNAIYAIKPYNYMGLIVKNRNSIEQNLSSLDFNPSYYNLYHRFVTADICAELKGKGMEIIPWTVNTTEEGNRLYNMGITDIITDFPDLFL